MITAAGTELLPGASRPAAWMWRSGLDAGLWEQNVAGPFDLHL
ncbi:hypothetical protein ACIFQM_16545 [Paenibacillus sp. NRS-1782]